MKSKTAAQIQAAIENLKKARASRGKVMHRGRLEKINKPKKGSMFYAPPGKAWDNGRLVSKALLGKRYLKVNKLK